MKIKQNKTNRKKILIKRVLIGLPFLTTCLLIAIYILTNTFNYSRMLAFFPYESVLGAHTIAIKPINPSRYYGAGVDMSQLLPTSTKYVKNSKGEDLIDIAAKLGINMLRITNATPAFDNKESIYTKAEWDTVLNKLQEKGIKAVLLIESPVIHQKYILSSYLPFVQSYIIDSGVLSHPAVYGVDLYNEAVINSSDNIAKLKTASQMIKSKYPQTKITVGWWTVDTFKTNPDGSPIYKWDDYRAGRKLSGFIDFYSLHMYGFDQPIFGLYPDPYVYTKGFISDVKNSLQTQKPILIEEFGAANGEAVSDQDTLGSPELQANTYQGVYQALIDMNDPQLIGTTAYQYISRLSGPDAWAIVKNNGDSIFPAAYALQLYAMGKSDISLPLPYANLPNDYLFTNSDDKTTKTMKINDIAGFKLTLDPSKTYTLDTSGDNILSATQTLTNYWGQNKYYAVFHATALGSTTITIKQEGNTVFEINIKVE